MTMQGVSMASLEKRQMLGQNILLESGTNELELLVFLLDGDKYGINVAKVREVIFPLKVHPVPKMNPLIEGAIESRNEIVPLICLRKHLNLPPHSAERLADPKGTRIIVAEFNKITSAYRVDSVARIHRFNWEQIQPAPQFGDARSSITAITQLGDDFVQLLDFESIIDSLRPIDMLRSQAVKAVEGRVQTELNRADMRLAIAEDSSMIRRVILKTLTESGYTNVKYFADGREIWEWISQQAEASGGEPFLDLVISDIEMPNLDGLHLTKLIREHDQLKSMPVILFSSLISEHNRRKGEQVGATAQISKPDLPGLVKLVDNIFTGQFVPAGAT